MLLLYTLSISLEQITLEHFLLVDLDVSWIFRL